MKVGVFIIFIVIQAIVCEKATSKLRRKLIIPKINDKCKKIKCAAIEEPECVKLKRQDLGRTFYINVINKCELDYIKCHDDVEAKIVPMKFCGHSNGGLSGYNKKINTGAAHRRVKRKTKTSDDLPAGSNAVRNKTEQLKPGKPSSDHRKHNIRKNEASNMISKDPDVPDIEIRTKNKVDEEQHIRQTHTGYPYSSEPDTDIEKNERKKINKGIAGYRIDIEYEDSVHLKKDHRHAGLQETVEQVSAEDLKSHEEKNKKTTVADGFPMISIESANNSKDGLNDADLKEYDALCPGVCPSRDVMVCAKCQHGIYKTFISVCHMRMFACNHNDEVLQLVARYPCVLSAPFVSESDMKPKGRIVEPGDDDKILRFIMCRDRSKLGSAVQSDDPRCTHEAEQLKYTRTRPTRPGPVYVTFPDWFAHEGASSG